MLAIIKWRMTHVGLQIMQFPSRLPHVRITHTMLEMLILTLVYKKTVIWNKSNFNSECMKEHTFKKTLELLCLVLWNFDSISQR